MRCVVCETKNNVVGIRGFNEHEDIGICKRCLEKALALDAGATLEWNGKLVHQTRVRELNGRINLLKNRGVDVDASLKVYLWSQFQ